MQDKNYTNPEDRGRFGFSMSGEYYTPFKAEGLLVALLISIAVLAGLALVYALGRINTQHQMEQESSSTFVLLGSAIALIAFVVILILVFGVGVRSVKKGFRCHYSASDETFTTTIGGDLHVIRYDEVSNIHFDPRSSFGKVRGYDITIKIKGRDEHYSVCSDGYLSPQATPFFIIQERLELRREKRSSGSAVINTSHADTKAISRAEVDRAKSGSISALDRMAQLLGETSNMPALSADSSPASQAAARVTQMLNESAASGGMPAIGEAARPVNTYISDDGRERSVYDSQTEGSFYIKPKPIKVILFAAIIMGVIAGLFILTKYYFDSASIWLGLIYVIFCYVWPVAFPAAEIIALYSCLTKVHGPLHSYRADGRGFYVTVKGGGSEQILYKDVLSVDYKPVRLLWGAYGYKVDILTSYGVVHYDYIYPRFNHKVPRQYLPFEAIKKNMPNKDSEETY